METEGRDVGGLGRAEGEERSFPATDVGFLSLARLLGGLVPVLQSWETGTIGTGSVDSTMLLRQTCYGIVYA